MRKPKKNYIALKLSKVMLVLIVLQAAAIIGTIIATGVIDSIRGNAYDSFSGKVMIRKNYLENDMNLRFSNIVDYAQIINNNYDRFVKDKTVISEEDTDSFLLSSTTPLLNMLRSTSSSGCFLILNNNNTRSSQHSAVYFTDTDPALSDATYKDLQMLAGPVDVSRKMQIPLGKSWTYGMALREENREIFDKPYSAALSSKTSNIKLLGYWTVTPSYDGNNMDMLTYSIPLLDKNNNPYGVIGIELNQDYLYKLLPEEELSEKGSLGYMLMRSRGEQLEIAMLNGAMQKELARNISPINLTLENDKYKVFNINHKEYDVLSHLEPLKLYNHNTPFEEDGWYLMGLNYKDDLLSFSQNVFTTLMISVIVSISIAMIAVFLIGINFAKPIVALARKVRTNDPKKIVDISPIGIGEIDELSSAIVELNKNVFETATKTDEIINLVGISLGTFEYQKGSNHVKCSKGIFELLGFPIKENEEITTVESEEFLDRINEVKQNTEDEAKHIYMIKAQPPRYVRIETLEQEGNISGAVMDVTREILENHAIRFERDYDSLTSIYNRFAFKRETLEIFAKGIKGVAAFIMFDLDNLKYINDTYGHDTGDIYIKEAAKGIYSAFIGDAIVGRMSGDEFYVFVYNRESKEEILNVVQTMYEGFEFQLLALEDGTQLKIRMSGGISWYREDSINLDELIRYADFAMYKGKHSIKGELRRFDKTVYESESFMLSGREELHNILENQLVEYAFQPIIDVKTGEIYAYESLLRPQSSVLTSPLKLIQIATAQSKLWQIEKITFFKTLSSYKRFYDLFNGCKIFINSVPSQILKDEEYKEIETLYADVLNNVVVEITENEKLDSETLVFKKSLIERWGGLMALDDYGSGYSGDGSLLSIAPNIVKIDKFMIENIETDKNRQSIVQKLLVYAKEQGILVVAEGVETKAQLQYLVLAGVDLLQGFYIGRPRFIPDFSNAKIKAEISDILKEEE